MSISLLTSSCCKIFRAASMLTRRRFDCLGIIFESMSRIFMSMLSFIETGINSITAPEGRSETSSSTIRSSKIPELSFLRNLSRVGFSGFSSTDSSLLFSSGGSNRSSKRSSTIFAAASCLRSICS